MSDCPKCGGAGELDPCHGPCEGKGRYEYNPHHPYSSPDGDKEEECQDCSGTGISCCPACEGTGVSPPTREPFERLLDMEEDLRRGEERLRAETKALMDKEQEDEE